MDKNKAKTPNVSESFQVIEREKARICDNFELWYSSRRETNPVRLRNPFVASAASDSFMVIVLKRYVCWEAYKKAPIHVRNCTDSTSSE